MMSSWLPSLIAIVKLLHHPLSFNAFPLSINLQTKHNIRTSTRKIMRCIQLFCFHLFRRTSYDYFFFFNSSFHKVRIVRYSQPFCYVLKSYGLTVWYLQFRYHPPPWHNFWNRRTGWESGCCNFCNNHKTRSYTG